MAYTPPNPNNQATMANSSPVVIASDQSELSITRPDTTASGSITTQNLVPAGTATAGSAVEITVSNGQATLTIQTTGTYTGVLSLQGTVDGSTWVTYGGTPLLNVNTGGVLATITSALQSTFQADVSGFNKVRVTGLAAMTGTAVVTLRASIGGALFALDSPITIAASQTLATVTTVTTVTNITNQGHLADNAAFVDGTTRVMMAGYTFDETAGTALTENDAAAARIDSKRAAVQVLEDSTTRGQRQSVNTSGGASVTQTPHTAGGLTTYHLVSAATTNATVIKASAGQVYGWYIYNSNAAARKLVFHNASSTPTAGASVFFSLMIPPTSGANVEMTNGIAFSTGISITTVTGLADSDSAAVALNDLVVNIWYK